MKKIATLGPKGTYSEIATMQYLKTCQDKYEIIYYPSIKKTLKSLGNDSDLVVLPIENLSEGYIPLVLDYIVNADVYIIDELMLPIHFSYVSTANNFNKIEKLFVQFVAKGQCLDFIESLNDVKVLITESNIESLDKLIEIKGNNAAIVPANSFSLNNFTKVIDNVNDYKNNKTRFLVFATNGTDKKEDGKKYKTSIVVLDDNDHPGLLSDILFSFSRRKINLTSIVSRPTREEFGKYHFFIDIDGHIKDTTVASALEEINSINKVKVIGSYPKALELQ